MMKSLNTSLLREKFVIHDPNGDMDDNGTVIALSNRIPVELRNEKDELVESFVIRTQNMHGCVRLAARIVTSFAQGGALMTRAVAYDWASAWDAVCSEYEQSYNPNRWVAVYNNGKMVFESGKHHPFLDVIEKCEARNKGVYDDSIIMAEDAFKQAGKVIKIEYDANMALVVNLEKTEGRCGIIMRGPDKTTTFNFSASGNGKSLNFAQCLGASAAFLEGIQLAFMIGMNTEKIRIGLIERHSQQEKQTREARRQLSRLSAEVTNFETAFKVRYRPEKPEFQSIVIDAERLAQKTLEKPKSSSGRVKK
jgi:hypothetical protein